MAGMNLELRLVGDDFFRSAGVLGLSVCSMVAKKRLKGDFNDTVTVNFGYLLICDRRGEHS